MGSALNFRSAIIIVASSLLASVFVVQFGLGDSGKVANAVSTGHAFSLAGNGGKLPDGAVTATATPTPVLASCGTSPLDGRTEIVVDAIVYAISGSPNAPA